MKPLFVLGRDTLIYGAADFLIKLATFLTFPVIARAWSTGMFGVFELLLSMATLLGLFANCGLNNSVQRFYWEASDSKAKGELVTTGFLVQLGLCVGLASSFLVLWAGLQHYEFLQSKDFSNRGILATLILMVGTQLTQFVLDVLRLHMKPWLFLSFNVSSRLPATLVGVGGVLIADWRVEEFILAQALVVWSALPLGLWLVRSELSLGYFCGGLIKKLLKFGYPFIFAGMAFWILASIDRWMLAWMTTIESVGLYSIGARFSMVILFISMAFGQAWSPFALHVRTTHKERHQEIYASILEVLSASILLFGGFVALFANEMVRMILPVEYYGAAGPLAILSFSCVLQAIVQVPALGISLAQKTVLFIPLNMLAIAVNFFLNLLFIPPFGIAGASAATLIAYLVLACAYFVVSQRLYPLPLSFERLGKIAITGLGLGLLALPWREYEFSFMLIAGKLSVLAVCSILLIRIVAWKVLIRDYR